jgi:uncharacterized protein YggE
MTRLPRIVFAALLVPPLAALAQPAPQPPTIEQVPSIVVTGHGETTARPDRATARVGATAQAKDAAAAQNQVSETIGAAIEKIRSLGIPEQAIQSQAIDLSPVYSNPGSIAPSEPKITGYRASSTLQIRIDDLTKVGPVIDAAVASGANQIQGVSFELKNDTSQRQSALHDAAQQARSKAEAIAQALGVVLGPIQEVQEQGAAHMPIPYAMGAPRASFDMAQTPVQPGELTVSADLTVRFRIGQPGH